MITRTALLILQVCLIGVCFFFILIKDQLLKSLVKHILITLAWSFLKESSSKGCESITFLPGTRQSSHFLCYDVDGGSNPCSSTGSCFGRKEKVKRKKQKVEIKMLTVELQGKSRNRKSKGNRMWYKRRLEEEKLTGNKCSMQIAGGGWESGEQVEQEKMRLQNKVQKKRRARSWQNKRKRQCSYEATRRRRRMKDTKKREE